MKRLYRSEKDKKVFGIFGGFGEVYGFDSTVLRLIFIVFWFFTGLFPFTVLYILAAIIIPKKSDLK
ncbi:MAG TPA: PspC domain-containing protein [Candidatus Paceibacterota bacterium]